MNDSLGECILRIFSFFVFLSLEFLEKKKERKEFFCLVFIEKYHYSEEK